ncbi:MAG TPA: carboxypeptidase-like regulatory domain-containing protein [Candidatus Thermoplasmatota archaeon]|nr:carboxypeptidase-like regulatory domain-containing protein [Candidatus Thermoplasmatota archaeon]
MRRFHAPSVIVLVAVATLAGCVSEGKAPAAARSSEPAPAAEPVVALDTGSITGVVVSDEEQPISAARVAVIETKNGTETDAGGRFTFNGLQPGAYGIIVEALGFASASRKVDVKGGEVSEQRFVLETLSYAEPYIESRKFAAYIVFGESFVDIGTHEVTEELCKPCHFWFLLTPDPGGARLETDWRPPVTVSPALNDDIFVLLCKDLANTTTKYRCSGPSGYMKNRAQLTVDPGFFKGVAKARLDVHAGMSVAYELRPDVYMSLSYLQELPAEYTALPPR